MVKLYITTGAHDDAGFLRRRAASTGSGRTRQTVPMLTTDTQIYDREAAGCLNGARCWLISAGKAGMLTQANAIADALGVEASLKLVSPRGVWRMMAPWGPVSPAERFGAPDTAFAPPWPDIAIAVGRASIPYIRALRRKAGRGCYTIVLQDPRSGAGTADLIWVPAHDNLRGSNVITTLFHRTALHSMISKRCAANRRRRLIVCRRRVWRSSSAVAMRSIGTTTPMMPAW